MALTTKQEKFCQSYVELGNASEAYRRSYDASRMKTESINRKAKELIDNGNVAARIAELKQRAAVKHDVTVATLLRELEEARTIALSCETPQTSAAVSATMGKAKLCGLDKQLIELSGEVNSKVELTTAQRKMLDKVLDDEC